LTQEQHLLELAESPPAPPDAFQQGNNQVSRLPQSLPLKNQDYWTDFDSTATSRQLEHLLLLDEPEGKRGTKLTLAEKVEIIGLRDSPHASTMIQLARDFKVPFHRHSTFCI